MPKLRAISEVETKFDFNASSAPAILYEFTEYAYTKSCTSRFRPVKIDHLAPAQLFLMRVPKDPRRYDVNPGRDFKIHEFPDMNIRVGAWRTSMKPIRFIQILPRNSLRKILAFH